MKLLIINGSPHAQKLSNTDKIVKSFVEGYCASGNTYEYFALSNRKCWDEARKAFAESDNILIASCVYVESLPGPLLEFLASLPRKDSNTQLSFLLQGGFSEAGQFRVVEEIAGQIPARLGCKSGGVLIRGNGGSGEMKSYVAMGKLFAEHGNFFRPECLKFAGPEILPWPIRLLVSLIFKTNLKRRFQNEAKKRGCTEPLDARPYLCCQNY